MFSKITCGAVVALALSTAAGSASASIDLTNGTLFRSDASGTNQNTSGSTISRGAWGTVLGQQNVPGNYGAQLFLATTPTPAAADFIAPASSFALSLQDGANKIYFWADGDDVAGGSAAFGLNLWFDGAAAGAVGLSALTPTPGATFSANSSACTAAYNFTCVAGTGALNLTIGASTITLTDFRILGIGNGSGGEDRVYHDNVNGYAPPAHSNGVNDTYGYFVLNVVTDDATGGVPEPTTWALMIAGFGLAGTTLRSRRRVAA